MTENGNTCQRCRAKNCHHVRRASKNESYKTMNIFEDLIDELKEENLIEQTVIEVKKAKDDSDKKEKSAAAAVQPEIVRPAETVSKVETTETDSSESAAQNPPIAVEAEAPENAANEADIYRQRAIEEVTFLQMVEAAFAGVEREQMKIIPKPFDDLAVKKVLHLFLQAAADANSDEHARAQFALLQETESWHSSLALRDKRMLTANLRRYCETSRPPLSSPALIALARFYRNSSYSEQVRSKFDLVVTRLFSKETGDSRRELVFTHDELVAHLKELYADWSSVPLYATEETDAEINSTIETFQKFAAEADEALSFDELVKSNFFNRLHFFKEATNENFFAPVVTATGIETNVRVGNRYVELVQREKELGGADRFENKYGFLSDSISEATSKTLSLVELLNQKKPEPAPVEEKPVVKAGPVKKETAEEKAELPKEQSAEEAALANSKSYKWVFVATAVVALLILAIYFTAKPDSNEPKPNQPPPKISIENSSLFKEYLQEARIQEGALSGIVAASWNSLTDEKKREALKQMLNLGGAKGYTKVRLVDEKGVIVGSAENGSVFLN